jgi:LacI family transcriptional regulator
MRERLPRAVTLSDVAREARVSVATASRAMRGDPVRAETRARVLATAKRLGYAPNRFAQSLRAQRSMFVGVIVPDIGHGAYARTIRAAQDILEDAGYQMLLMNTHRDPQRDQIALRSMLANNVDGLLFASYGGIDTSPPVPTVFFDALVPGAGDANVIRANGQGMDLLVGHLAETHGDEKIAYLGSPVPLTSGTERLEGFRDAMRKRSLPVRDEYVVMGDTEWSPESGTAAMNELLALADPPRAVVAASDTFALGAIQAAIEHGLVVPDDLAIVSFDDTYFGAMMEPQLTALKATEGTLGKAIASLLLQSLERGGSGESLEIRIPVELVVRRSCGCHGRAARRDEVRGAATNRSRRSD